MRKYYTLIALLLVGLMLITSHLLAGNEENMETLYGIQLYEDKLAVRVKSNGCTQAEHFSVQTAIVNDSHLLTVVRQKPDRCRKMPRIINIELELPAAKKRSYQLVNPLQSG